MSYENCEHCGSMQRVWEKIPHGIAQNPRNPLIFWRLYYADSTKPNDYYTFDNLDGTPEEAPVDNVICILQFRVDQSVDTVSQINTDDVKVHSDCFMGKDLYFMNENGRWQAGEDHPTLEERRDRGIPYSAVKNGYWTDLETYKRILQIASFDTDFNSGIIYPTREQ